MLVILQYLQIWHIVALPCVSSELYTMPGPAATIRLSQDQSQSLATQPGDHHIRPIEPGSDQQRIVRPPLKPHHDRPLLDRDRRRGVDQVPEQMTGFGDLV